MKIKVRIGTKIKKEIMVKKFKIKVKTKNKKKPWIKM